MRFFFKIFLAAIVPAVVISSILVASAYYSGKSVIEGRIDAQLNSVSVLKQQAFSNFIAECNQTIGMQADNVGNLGLYPDVSGVQADPAVGVSGLSAREMAERYLSMSMNGNDIYELFIMDLRGRIWASTDSRQEGKVKVQSKYFVEGLHGRYVEWFYYSMSLQRPAFTISTPIKDVSGRTVGVLAGRINLDRVNEILVERNGLGDSGESILVNGFHFLVTKSRFESDMELRKVINTQAVSLCLNKTHGFGEFVDYRGVTSYVNYAWLPTSGLCIITKIDVSEALGPLDDVVMSFVMIAAFGIALTSVACVIFSKSVVKPIESLRNAMLRVGKGFLNTEIDTRSDDEVGDLARSFKSMISEIRKSRVRDDESKVLLEKTVKKRTHELNDRLYELEKFKILTTGRELRMVELKKRIAELEVKLRRRDVNREKK
jgi:HAMP domain-containing protein